MKQSWKSLFRCEVTAPGFLVRVHVPDEGRPLRTTLPVGTAQVGWVGVPAEGGEGDTFTVISDALGSLVTTGLLDITLILYWVPYPVPGGMTALISPELMEADVPIVKGEEKSPEALLSSAVKTLPLLNDPSGTTV